MKDGKLEQGDIIKMNFDPHAGHEQAGYRPALVVSNGIFNDKANVVMVCPITNTSSGFPLHVSLDGRTKTTGEILCEHQRSCDLVARGYRFVEELPQDLLQEVIDILTGQVEILPED